MRLAIIQRMADGGAINDNDKYSELFLRVTRVAGLLIPFVAVAYGIAAMHGIVDRSPAFGARGFVVIAALFILLGIMQAVFKPAKPVSLGIYIGFYHLFGAMYLFVGPGFISPIAFCWIVLAFITEIFYGRWGALISLTVITFTALTVYLAEPVGVFDWVQYTVYLMIIIVSSVLVILLRRVQLVEHEDLKRTQIQEQFQREQLRALINNVGMAIVSTTSGGTIQTYNAALLELLDSHETLTGKKLDEVFHFIDRTGQPAKLQDILFASSRLVERDDLRHQFASGETMHVSLICAPISNHISPEQHESGGYIFIIRDITKFKSLEEERDEFISVVSHELRTPVAIVEGTISMMLFELERKKDPAYLTPKFKEAHKQVLYLASMLQDLTTLSSAEKGLADKAETVIVGDLLTEIYQHFAERADAKKIGLQLELPSEPVQIVTSKLYLKEIIDNFMTNAIKYTETGSVTLSAKSLGTEIGFSVADSGIGISKSDQKRIFEKFYRSEDYLTRKHSGTGLGLYVVQKLAQKIQGHVVVDSVLNEGSTFTLILPVKT